MAAISVMGLHPHLAGGTLGCFATCASGRLHQEAEQALWCPKVAGKQGTVWVDGRHQGDIAEIMPFGNHLRADQHIHLARMHLRQLLLQSAFELGGVGVDARDTHGCAVGAFDVRE
jgi:hypothetical protein